LIATLQNCQGIERASPNARPARFNSRASLLFETQLSSV
jgi:hypothetical protein